jgi:uncharacterized small protein (DUF1192 family)
MSLISVVSDRHTIELLVDRGLDMRLGRLAQEFEDLEAEFKKKSTGGGRVEETGDDEGNGFEDF